VTPTVYPILGGIAGLAVLLTPRLRRSVVWRAAMTPLASIIGSGFLIVGPILIGAFGWAAPLIMAALCVLAYAIGAAVRDNIRTTEEIGPPRRRLSRLLEEAGDLSLALAYLISVGFYLALFGAFAARLLPEAGEEVALVITSAALLLILGIGLSRGFALFERLEVLIVSLKLVVIAGLLLALVAYAGGTAREGALILPAGSTELWAGVALCFGLIVTTQGFETAQYLGDVYTAETRQRAMKVAQWVSGGIYVLYVTLITFALPVARDGVTETEIIDLMAVVSPVLPLALIVAALSAQLSAAIADTSGFSGLIREVTRGRVAAKPAYTVLVLAGLVMVWTLDVFTIVSLASRAFALYYATQCALAAARRWRGGMGWRGWSFAALTAICLAAAVFGVPFETAG